MALLMTGRGSKSGEPANPRSFV